MNGGTELGGLEQGIEGRDDGVTQARRCVKAALGEDDVDTFTALLRAALRYTERADEGRGPCQVIAFPSRFQGWVKCG